jgi:hypothetical protein
MFAFDFGVAQVFCRHANRKNLHVHIIVTQLPTLKVPS